MLILMRGLPAVGKSTLARAIGRELKIPVLDKDDIGDILFPVLRRHEAVNPLCYDVLWAMARTQLSLGTSVIVDSPLRFPADYERVLAWAGPLGATVRPIRVTCSDHAIWAKRLEGRSQHMPEHRFRTWQNLQQYYGSTEVEPIAGECVLDTVQGLDENVEMCIRYLLLPPPDTHQPTKPHIS